MRDGEEFLWTPVLAGLCRYESVIDGTLDLADFATMNELLVWQAETRRRNE